MSDGAVHLVWFKRDLRLEDHEPLFRAAREGAILGLYIYEPELLHSPEFSAAHLLFINESLRELEAGLAERGGRLITRVGEAVEVLDRLAEEWPVAGLWSHAETGNALTYARDLRVASWAQRRGIRWQEFRQDGVIRRLRQRDGWAARWAERMNRPVFPVPTALRSPQQIPSHGILGPEIFSLLPNDKTETQPGGMAAARERLESFLMYRGVNYRAEMSSPVTGWEGCSRLSPYLALGCISLRTVHRAVAERLGDLRLAERMGAAVDRRWFGSLASFSARLRWHCHFMQKLEDEPRIEFENFSRAYDGLREEFSQTAEAQERLRSWQEGRTGYPMVDACMRAVRATGWLNFRMRAMVASFAAYHLWLHWREPAVFLARHFLDFDPGIHFSQFQMQSGTTGINTVRIYSPAKQVLDQDPGGEFIRRWVPELCEVPNSWLPQPERMSEDLQRRFHCVIGVDYPPPIVEHAEAVRQARERLAAVRRSASARGESRRVLLRHGSRKRPARR